MTSGSSISKGFQSVSTPLSIFLWAKHTEFNHFSAGGFIF
jgi:hypothetical protein